MAAIRSATEITQIINRSQHAIADLGTELVDEEKRGITSADTAHRDKMYRLILLRALLHNILDDNANVRLFYSAAANEIKFNKILDGLLQLSQSFDGPGINIIGVRRNLITFTGSGGGSGGGGQANPGGTTFQNLGVNSPSANIDSFNANDSTFALYIYSVLGTNSGEGSRTGTIIASWNGSNTPNYAETRTADVGGITTPITFKVELVSGQIQLNAYTTTNGWIVKGVRILFQNISFINPTGGIPTGGTTGQFLRKASNADLDATWQSLVWTMLTDVTSSLAEINRVTGVTSPIQTQLNAIVSSLANYLLLTGGTMSGAIAMGGSKITGLGAASVNGDAVRYEQLLSFTPVQQGGGLNQYTNKVYIGWGNPAGSGLRATVDATDLGILLSTVYNTGDATIEFDTPSHNIRVKAGSIGATQLAAQPSWTSISLINGWTGTIYYRTNTLGMVSLRGTIISPGTSPGSAITSAGAIPNAIALAEFLVALVGTSKTGNHISVSATGVITMEAISSSSEVFNLSSVHYWTT